MNGSGCSSNCDFCLPSVSLRVKLTTGSTDLNSPGFETRVGTEIMPEDPFKDASCGGVFGRSLKCISLGFGGDSTISGV